MPSKLGGRGFALVLWLLLALSGVPAAAWADVAASSKDYVLGVGERLRVTVFNEPDLSGEFEVSSTGTVSLPLIGEVQAAHNTLGTLQGLIATRLADGYVRTPHVNVEVLNYRPFFILGEVMKPGSYTYANGMSVVNAVALAGGYTYRADRDGVTLKHGESGSKEEGVNETAPVVPGDIINVPERFF